MADDDGAMGPISYLIVEFPGNQMTGEGFAELMALVDGGLIRVLDLRFVSRADDGSVVAIELADLDLDGDFDVAVFEGASSGLLDQSDLDDAKEAIAPGSSAGILLFENRWATRFVHALRGGGAELVAAGYIPHRECRRVARRDRRLNQAQPGRITRCQVCSEALPAPPSSPAPPLRSPTACRAGRPTVGRDRSKRSTPSRSTTSHRRSTRRPLPRRPRRRIRSNSCSGWRT